MKKLGNRKYYENGTKKFEAWFNADGNDFIEEEVIRHKNFKWWHEITQCFKYKDKLYTEDGIDHFNGHMSGFSDNGAVYGVYLREIINC